MCKANDTIYTDEVVYAAMMLSDTYSAVQKNPTPYNEIRFNVSLHRMLDAVNALDDYLSENAVDDNE